MSRSSMLTGYRAYVLFILVVVYTFNFVDRQIVGILAVPIKTELALSDTRAQHDGRSRLRALLYLSRHSRSPGSPIGAAAPGS